MIYFVLHVVVELTWAVTFRQEYSAERKKKEKFLGCSNLICMDVSAQAFIEGPLVIFFYLQNILEQLLFAPCSSALLCMVVLQCFEVACLFQDSRENQSTETQKPFCVLDIIYHLGNLSCFLYFSFC